MRVSTINYRNVSERTFCRANAQAWARRLIQNASNLQTEARILLAKATQHEKEK
jgi:hypothetical protein